jgi:ABC-type Mn2+/Zn2+ transport system permease subunit
VTYLLIGLTIAIAVMTVGPLVAFGFLLLPPLTVYLFARTIRALVVGASLVGGVCALIGFCLAYGLDLPAGPTEVALLGVVHLAAVLVRPIIKRIGQRTRLPPRNP